MTDKALLDLLRVSAGTIDLMRGRMPDPSTGGVIRTEESAEVRHSLADLAERLDKLVLINMAMWSLLRQHTQLTEEDLMERVREIDLIDGTPDGRVTRQIARCSSCQRVMSPRHTRCLYCGEPKLTLTAFDAIS